MSQSANTSTRNAPSNIKLHQRSRLLEISFESGETFQLPCEYLRVHSPSAEVRGHGKGQEVLQLDKHNVNIIAVEPVGSYAIRLVFDDAHDSGLFSWDYLYDLGKERASKWQNYLDALDAAGHTREAQENDRYLSDQ